MKRCPECSRDHVDDCKPKPSTISILDGSNFLFLPADFDETGPFGYA